MSTALRLLITGPLPPPKGGVSVHISRLVTVLANRGISVDVIDESPVRKAGAFNLRSFNLIGYLARFRQAEVVHVHSSVDLFRIINAITALLFRKRFLVTLHSWRPRGRVSQMIHRWIFQRAHTVVCVSPPIANQVTAVNVVVRPAFIPPQMSNEPELPADIAHWIEQQRDNGNTIIASNAYQLDRYDGEDIYGTDLCIEMMHELVNVRRRKVVLVFNVASLAKGQDAFNHYRHRISELALDESVLLINEPELSFVRLLKQSDLSVRATNTDGDALSIREGLSFGKTVIASDVVDRPKGTELFANRSIDSLVAAVIRELDSEDKHDDAQTGVEEDDSYEFYMGLYANPKGH